MLVNDKVYGEFKIDEPVLVELINSPTIQRLKHISQFGLPQEYYHVKVFSRFEHSLGVMLLLKRLNASLKEQIAGLLHDISHTAFSHVIDWVIGDPSKEDHQDNKYAEVLISSEISNILGRYGFKTEDFIELENYTLLEKEAPSLCADRIDYSLRELFDLGMVKEVSTILDKLISFNENIVFSEKNIAEVFGTHYMRLQREHWAGIESKIRYHIISKVLKKALDLKIISLQDFNKTDNEIIKELESSNDKSIKQGLKWLKEGFKVSFSDKGVDIRKKFRYVDPEVLVGNNLISLSSLSNKYKETLDKDKEESKKIVKIKIE